MAASTRTSWTRESTEGKRRWNTRSCIASLSAMSERRTVGRASVRKPGHNRRISCYVWYRICGVGVKRLDFTDAVLMLGRVNTRWSVASCHCFALGNANGVPDIVFAEPVGLTRDFEVRDCGLWDRIWCLNNFGDRLRGVGEEGQCCEPNIMPLSGDSCEFECSGWSQDQD
jgi:hypothetical protein